jgi:ribosomal protein S18 acetylase RimI-like enzyme
VIRHATRDDADALGEIGVRAFRHNYAEILDPEFLAGLDAADWAGEWRAAIGHGDRVVLVAEVADRVVGFASVRDDGDLRTLYVDPVAQGAGVGTQLLAEAEAAGARSLEVFEANGHARGFYEARGWRDAGPAGAWLDRPLRRYVR